MAIHLTGSVVREQDDLFLVQDELETLRTSGRCGNCGHLDTFHWVDETVTSDPFRCVVLGCEKC